MKVLLLVIAFLILLFIPIYAIQVISKIIFLLIILSWIYSKITKNKVKVHFEKRIIRGFLFEHNIIVVHIVNESFLPISMIAFRDEIASLNLVGQNSGVFFLKAHSKAIFSYTIWSNHRGMYKLGPIHLASSDPLGLFPWSLQINLERLVFIYPHFALINLYSTHGLISGPLNSNHPMYLDTTQIKSIRNYQAGDDTRFIHWKASAKTGALQVSDFNKSITLPFYLILNLNQEDYYNKKRGYHLERVIEVAAAFIQSSMSNNFSIGFLCNGTIPTETETTLNIFGENAIHYSISQASLVSSQILSLLSIIQFSNKNLLNLLTHLQFQLTPRCIFITPSLETNDFNLICSYIPRNCQTDFWFLDEHILREDRITHKSVPTKNGIKIMKIPEYGDDLMEDN